MRSEEKVQSEIPNPKSTIPNPKSTIPNPQSYITRNKKGEIAPAPNYQLLTLNYPLLDKHHLLRLHEAA